MKIVVENLIYKLFHKEIVELDPNIEIISLNAEDPNNPAWQEVLSMMLFFILYISFCSKRSQASF